MKGMLNVLERAGLIRRDHEGTIEPASEEAPEQGAVGAAHATPSARVESIPGMSLAQIYEAAGVPASAYPAERLIRLVDGLKAMDEATRMTAIRAMDAADESWSIADPVNDAMSKIEALEAHAKALRSSVERAEAETATSMAAIKQRQEGAEADIRRQISELEALLAREIQRGTEECAAMEAALRVKKDACARELDMLAAAAGNLRGLVGQYGPNTEPSA